MRLDVYSNTNYAPPNPTTSAPDGAPYLGCYADTPARLLPEKIISEDDMTAARCAVNCEGYAYFGTQWSRECYCGNTAPGEDAKAAESDCNMPCAGDATELCGAGMRLSLYGPIGSAPPVPTETGVPTTSNPVTVGDFNYAGCYTDSVALRVLSGSTITSPDMTLTACAAICADYTYFGVEFGTQCFCSMTLDASGVKSPEAECALPCGGDESLLCGDANRLSVYQKAPSDEPSGPSNPATVGAFHYQSCWTDAVGARSLTGKSEVQAGLTAEMCAAFCDGYAYFGLEYQTECYCSNELAGEAADEADCSMLCGGSSSQWCGGPNRLNLYAVNPVTPSSSAVPSVTAPPASTTITPGPELTTVTSCSSGLVGGPETKCLAQLPAYCNSLSSSMDWWMGSMSAMMCNNAIGSPMPTNIASCFPTGYVPTATASSIYSCLQTNAVCSYAEVCATATYTVGAEPTAPPASPTDATTNANANAIPDGGFENGDISGWTLTDRGAGPFLFTNASTDLARSGNYALKIVAYNKGGQISNLQRTVAVVPGAQYRLSMWVRDNNNAYDWGIGTFMVTPAVGASTARTELPFRYAAVNQWREVVLNFQAAGSWASVLIEYYSNGNGAATSTLDGPIVMYIDDVTLVRTDV